MDKIGFLRMCCERVIPLVYDESLSYLEMVRKVVYKINEVINHQEELDKMYSDVVELYEEFQALSDEVQKEIDNAIEGIDDKVYNAVNEIITDMINKGQLDNVNNPELMRITVVDIGTQGDCFVVSVGGKILMIDSGYNNDQIPIQNALNMYGTKVDYLVITHFDPDHVNGIINHYFDSYFGSWTTAFIGIHVQTEVDWYNENITTVINILTQLGVNIVYATEGQVVNIGLLTNLNNLSFCCINNVNS